MSVILGVDPGLSGAIALLNNDGELVRVDDMPIVTVKGARGRSKNLPDAARCGQIVRELVDFRGAGVPGVTAWIENVHSMPEQGIASAFNFGAAFGIWIGVLAALEIRTERVSPQRWKALVMKGTTGKDKEASRLRACELFPAVSLEFFGRKKDHGRAEAVLIAHYGFLSRQAASWPA